MPDDLRIQLERIARQPSRTPDVGAAWSRVVGRRRRHRTLAVSALAAVVFVAPWITDQFERPAIPEVAAVGEQGSSPSSMSGPPDAGRFERHRIDGYGVDLLVPASWARRQGDPTTWHGSQGSLRVRADQTRFSHVAASGVNQHCRDVAARLPDDLPQRPLEELTVSGQPACLVRTADGTRFVAVVRFPATPHAAGHASDLVMVGDGVDGRMVLSSVRFAPAVGGSCTELAPGQEPAECQTSP